MPYVPSEKTVPPAEDRKVIDAQVEIIATIFADMITDHLSLIRIYREAFGGISNALDSLLKGGTVSDSPEAHLARAIYETGEKYSYGGAYLGELNYAITRFIQRVPQIKVANGTWTDELRYWVYATTVEALMWIHNFTLEWGIGLSGVFMDIKDEYKRRMNTAYEAWQIVKSGDCYDGPYYTRLVPVVDESGSVIGYMEIMLKRDPKTVGLDLLDDEIVLRKRAS